jgi:hypothetical protein
MLLTTALLAICIPAAGWLGLYGYAWRQNRLRIADARPAFDPVLPPRVELLSTPCGTRYCSYYLRFPCDSLPSDANVGQITSLTKLPAENCLTLVIETPAITDDSLGVLKSLRNVDFLDLTKSNVSDDSLEQLAAALPDVFVIRRKSDQSE